MSDDKKVIFSMSGLSKSYNNNNKQVLKDIYLSFYYGAKIGIIGLNGSGKSTLLKIIAGVEKQYQGDVTFSDGYKVGYLEQEPKLDESKTVIEIVKEGMLEAVDALADYNAINDAFGLPENYEDADKMEKLMKEQGVLQDKIEASATLSFTIADSFKHIFSKRGWSTLNRIELNPTLVATIQNGDVYIVNCDLRNALLEQSSWGIHGHTTKSAVEIIDTLLED